MRGRLKLYHSFIMWASLCLIFRIWKLWKVDPQGNRGLVCDTWGKEARDILRDCCTIATIINVSITFIIMQHLYIWEPMNNRTALHEDPRGTQLLDKGRSHVYKGFGNHKIHHTNYWLQVFGVPLDPHFHENGGSNSPLTKKVKGLKL